MRRERKTNRVWGAVNRVILAYARSKPRFTTWDLVPQLTVAQARNGCQNLWLAGKLKRLRHGCGGNKFVARPAVYTLRFSVEKVRLRWDRRCKNQSLNRVRRLNPTQVEMLQLYASGMSQPEIATHLNKSLRAVNKQFGKIYKRLKIHCAQDAVRIACKAGLV